jgi:hypothetical protein
MRACGRQGSVGAGIRRGALMLAWTLVLGACFGTSQRRQEVLVQNARAFNDDWRWGRWDSMAGVMPSEDATAFLSRAQTLEPELVVADFEVTSITFAEQASRAVVVAKFEWYLKRDPVIKNTTVEQLWQFLENRWQVTKIRRTRGERFGLVLEPVESTEPEKPGHPEKPEDG